MSFSFLVLHFRVWCWLPKCPGFCSFHFLLSQIGWIPQCGVSSGSILTAHISLNVFLSVWCPLYHFYFLHFSPTFTLFSFVWHLLGVFWYGWKSNGGVLELQWAGLHWMGWTRMGSWVAWSNEAGDIYFYRWQPWWFDLLPLTLAVFSRLERIEIHLLPFLTRRSISTFHSLAS